MVAVRYICDKLVSMLSLLSIGQLAVKKVEEKVTSLPEKKNSVLSCAAGHATVRNDIQTLTAYCKGLKLLKK